MVARLSDFDEDARAARRRLNDLVGRGDADAASIARAAEEAAKKAMNTPEAKLAEKMRLQKLEENANLQLAKDMMGFKVIYNPRYDRKSNHLANKSWLPYMVH